MKDGSESSSAKESVAAFKEFINMVIPCDDTAFCKIGQAYLDNKKEMDKKIPGLAGFVGTAILYAYK